MRIRVIISLFLAVSVLSLCCQSSIKSLDFSCVIRSDQSAYKLGEVPRIKVEIFNNSEQDVYLLSRLDGSGTGRSPKCSFKIEKPIEEQLETGGFCGTLSPIQLKDFILLKRGTSFNPYHSSYNDYSYDHQLNGKENFRKKGAYKITFYYSSIEQDIESYLSGMYLKLPLIKRLFRKMPPKENTRAIETLFQKMPHIELQSNTIEIEII